MYTGQRHRSVLINSAMYISRATLVFSRASHDAKVVYYFFCVCALNCTTVIRSESLSSSCCLQQALFPSHSVIFPFVHS